MDLKKPYYLNDCSCGVINSCKICMSKRNKAVADKMTFRERFEVNDHKRITREAQSPEKKAALARYQRAYQAEYRAKKRNLDGGN